MPPKKKKQPAAHASKRAQGATVVRGLVITRHEFDKMTASDDGARQTLLIRNFQCRSLKAHETCHLLLQVSGRYNFHIVGAFKFAGNCFVPHAAFNTFHYKHQISPEEYLTLRQSWSSDKGGCVGWNVDDVSVRDPILKISSTTPSQATHLIT